MTDTDDKVASAFAREALREQRLARRWNTFFKALFFLYLLAILVLSIPNLSRGTWLIGEKFTALVDLQGVISSDSRASADAIITGLRAAFEDSGTAGVILRINSPGGSPVQSGYINDEIRRLRDEYPDIPLYAVLQDICASGGYYVAAAADEIYADKSTIVGSIGVRMDSFGFVESMEKLGVERRLLTAGEHKGFLDPFLPRRGNRELYSAAGSARSIRAQSRCEPERNAANEHRHAALTTPRVCRTPGGAKAAPGQSAAVRSTRSDRRIRFARTA